MMSRVLRRQCPEKIRDRITKAQGASFYVVQELGPTAFVLREANERLSESHNTNSESSSNWNSIITERKYRVCLGSLQTCTCSRHILENDLCIHILWVMLKIFHVPADSEMIYQKSLIEREIQELIRGRNLFRPRVDRPRQQQEQPTSSIGQSSANSADERQILEPRPIEPTDICPICQEELVHEKGWALTHCRYSCGNSIHVKCMKVLLDYQVKSMGVEILKCPLCRSDFGTVSELNQIISSATGTNNLVSTQKQPYSHMGTSCHECTISPITGNLHKCKACAVLYLCEICFKQGAHSEHAFEYKATRSSRPKPSTRVLPTILPQGLVQSLQERDLTDADYETLLMLDKPSVQGSLPLHIINRFPLVKILRPADREKVRLGDDLSCKICSLRVGYGEVVRQLPCHHGFHQACADRWLLHTRTTCPVCGAAAYSMIEEESNPDAIDSGQITIPRPGEAVYKAIEFQTAPNGSHLRRRLRKKKECDTNAETPGMDSVEGSLQILSISRSSGVNIGSSSSLSNIPTRIRETRHETTGSSGNSTMHPPTLTRIRKSTALITEHQLQNDILPHVLQVHSFGTMALSAEEIHPRSSPATHSSSSTSSLTHVLPLRSSNTSTVATDLSSIAINVGNAPIQAITGTIRPRTKIPTTLGKKTFGIPSNQSPISRRHTTEQPNPTLELEAKGIRLQD